MRKMTARSAKWMETVKANFAKATGKPVDAWVKGARTKGMDRDVAAARRWLREDEGLTTVQANYVLMTLFPETDDDEELLAGQYAGKKAALRPIYDALAKVAGRLGDDVMIAPRKSQVTFARHVTFAVVRAASSDRVDLRLRLAGHKPTPRLLATPRAAGSDPTHVVALSSAKDVDADVKKWLALAYERAARR
ncbi:MAG: DUF5655 domain-containing protein [Polyangiaceae bacterium]|jgi:hypothetical protein